MQQKTKTFMKKNEFIQLTPVNGENKYYINSMMICSIVEQEKDCVIYTMDGKAFHVNETPSEILNAIEKSKGISFSK
jgi:uncharacterized protein YlzI (FlbEa/FlbD family)